MVWPMFNDELNSIMDENRKEQESERILREIVETDTLPHLMDVMRRLARAGGDEMQLNIRSVSLIDGNGKFMGINAFLPPDGMDEPEWLDELGELVTGRRSQASLLLSASMKAARKPLTFSSLLDEYNTRLTCLSNSIPEGEEPSGLARNMLGAYSEVANALSFPAWCEKEGVFSPGGVAPDGLTVKEYRIIRKKLPENPSSVRMFTGMTSYARTRSVKYEQKKNSISNNMDLEFRNVPGWLLKKASDWIHDWAVSEGLHCAYLNEGDDFVLLHFYWKQ